MISKFLAALLALLLTTSAMATSLSFLHGKTFRDDQGYSKERSTMTLEHFGLWELGNIFFYYDITDPFKAPPNQYVKGYGHQPGAQQYFGGFTVNWSFNKIFGTKMGDGFVKDLYIHTEMENGSANGLFGFRNYFLGLQADIAVPGFDFVTVNTLVRDNPLDPGVGFQLGAAWQMSQEWSRWRRFKFTGFVAASPWNGDGDHDNAAVDKFGRFLTSQPQFLWDFGNGMWGKPNRFEIGAEYAYFLNRFQALHKDEKVIQALVKLSW
jgi:nucleoside-specific outer membrane channel protein Tsx